MIQKAVQALLLAQNSDGGWGETGDSNPLHTAWVLRALQELQTTPVEATYVARRYLEKSLDESGLQWETKVSALTMPFGGDFVNSADYTTLWAMETLAPIELLTSQRRPGARKRSLFDTNR
jgi:hypothetical protein